ncbi:MAG: hypothetical protein MUF54_21150 [Polyangiaceae bacterium]|jgi:hypothetical protein|nr:hypothetical protein [Polyangiaceae bacterium]
MMKRVAVRWTYPRGKRSSPAASADALSHGVVVGLLLPLAILFSQAGCTAQYGVRTIIIPGAGVNDAAQNAPACAEACQNKHSNDARSAAQCLDNCPGSYSLSGDECARAPAGAACYVLVTQTLVPDADSIDAVVRGVVAVAQIAAESADDGDDDDDVDGVRHRPVARSGSERHAARPSRAAARHEARPSQGNAERKRRHLRRK